MVVTAVQHGETGNPIARGLARDAARTVDGVGLERVISGEVLRRAAIGAAIATVALVAGFAAFAPTMSRGAAIAVAYVAAGAGAD